MKAVLSVLAIAFVMCSLLGCERHRSKKIPEIKVFNENGTMVFESYIPGAWSEEHRQVIRSFSTEGVNLCSLELRSGNGHLLSIVPVTKNGEIELNVKTDFPFRLDVSPGESSLITEGERVVRLRPSEHS